MNINMYLTYSRERENSHKQSQLLRQLFSVCVVKMSNTMVV